MADSRMFIGLLPIQAEEAKAALAFLAETGALQQYCESLYLDLARDSHGQTVDQLFESIQRVKADTQGIMALHHYGLRLAQELKGTQNEDS